MNLILTQKVVSNESPIEDSGCTPFSKYVNVELIGYEPRFGARSHIGTVLLENPVGKPIDYEELKLEITKIFGIYGCHFHLYNKNQVLREGIDILSLTGSMIHAVKVSQEVKSVCGDKIFSNPICKFLNLTCKDHKSTILLENPQGDFPVTHENVQKTLSAMFPNATVLLPPASPLQLHGYSLQTH